MPTGPVTKGAALAESAAESVECQSHDLLVEALARVGDPTRPAWGGALNALKAIESVSSNVTAAEIKQRGKYFLQKFPKARLTPAALAAAWDACGGPKLISNSSEASP